jgi:hypothetical protein
MKIHLLYFIQLHTKNVMQYLVQLHADFKISSTSATVESKIKIFGAQNYKNKTK